MLALAYLLSAGERIASRSPSEHFLHWRAHDDLALAVGYAARGEFPVAPYRVRDMVRRDRDPRFNAFNQHLQSIIDRDGLKPLQFWRTVAARDLSPDGNWRLGRRLDDAGRPFVLGAVFRAIGGVSPFLIFWLGVFMTAPVLGWLVLESARAGRLAGGAVFALAFSASAFVLDMGSTGYSAAGFHVLGLLVVLALGYYTALGEPTPRGLLLRCAAAGLVLGLAAFCRGTVLTFGPAIALAAVHGIRRLSLKGDWRIRRAGAWSAGLMFVLALPYIVINLASQGVAREVSRNYGRVEAPLYHDASLLIWKGLGDFDRKKGYTFWDMAGQAAVRKASPTGAFDRAGELRLRRAILGDIVSDPLWYADILARRLAATASLSKLWSYGPRDGTSIVPATSPNEGVIDNYYRLSRQADWLAFGSRDRELPTWLFLLPSALVLACALLARVSARCRTVWEHVRAGLLPLLWLALAILPVPLLITTATAFEAECFVLVHFLALGLLIDGATRAAAARAGSRP